MIGYNSQLSSVTVPRVSQNAQLAYRDLSAVFSRLAPAYYQGNYAYYTALWIIGLIK